MHAPANPRVSDAHTVLVMVDDDRDRIAVRDELEGSGAEVLCARSLYESLDLLEIAVAPVDAVVLDLRDGHDLDRTLDVLRAATGVPIVVRSTTVQPAAFPPGIGWVDRSTDIRAVAAAVEAAVAATNGAVVVPPGCDLVGSADFLAVADRVVGDLAGWTGIDTWVVTRRSGDDWIILAVHDPHYDLRRGDVLRWEDSFCARMVGEDRPRFVADTTGVPHVYADAPIGSCLQIGTYLAAPLVTAHDGLFGTLCGIQPAPHADPGVGDTLRGAVQTVALTLSTTIALDLQRSRLERRVEAAQSASRTDPLTGLLNRRAWRTTMQSEDARCRRYGHPATIAMLDLDGLKRVNDSRGHAAGDEVLRRAATILDSVLRGADTAYRLGGDEFAVVWPETGPTSQPTMLDRLRAAFADADIPVSVGIASVPEFPTLEAAATAADERMYDDKRHPR